MNDSLGKATRKIGQAVATGMIRGLNKAIDKTKTRVIRQLREETGLSSEQVYRRVLPIKAKKGKPNGSINIATKFDISLAYFKPKEKVVKLPSKRTSRGKGRPKNRTFYGTTVKIGNNPRQLVPGGFLRTVKSGKELVLARKGQARYPTVALKTDIFRKVAQKHQVENSEFLKKTVDELTPHEIEFALSQTLTKK